jgi:hypothetical protein
MVLSQFAKYNYCIYVVWFHRAYQRWVIVVLKDLKTKPHQNCSHQFIENLHRFLLQISFF